MSILQTKLHAAAQLTRLLAREVVRPSPAVAVVEFLDYHDELLPTWVHLFNRLGYAVDVYTSPTNIRNDIFANVAGLRFHLEESFGGGYSAWERLLRFRRYDVVVVNTLDDARLLDRVMGIDAPLLAVFHSMQTARAECYEGLLGRDNVAPVFLAKHLAEAFDPGRATWFTPCRLGEYGVAGNGIPVFCVQGQVDFARRNYQGLVAAVGRLARESAPPFRIRILGDGVDLSRLTGLIAGGGIADRFEFTGGGLPYPQYYERIATSDFMLPLLDESSAELASYFGDKVSSTIAAAIGLGVVPIMNARLAELFGLDEVAVTYRDDDLYGGLRCALEADPEGLPRRRRLLATLREACMAQGIRDIGQTVVRLRG